MSRPLTPAYKPAAVLTDARSTGPGPRPRLADIAGVKGTLKR